MEIKENETSVWQIKVYQLIGMKIKLSEKLSEKDNILICFRKNISLSVYAYQRGQEFAVRSARAAKAKIYPTYVTPLDPNKLSLNNIGIEKSSYEDMPHSTGCSVTVTQMDHQNCYIRRIINYYKENDYCIPPYIKTYSTEPLNYCTDGHEGVNSWGKAFGHVPYSDEKCPLPCKHDKYSLNLEYKITTNETLQCAESGRSGLIISFSTMAIDVYKQVEHCIGLNWSPPS